MAVDFVGIQTVQHHLNRIFQLNNHDFTVSSDFKQAVSAFKRSGHARFRRGPPVNSSDPQTPSVSSRSEEKLLNIVTDATASFQSPTSASEECCLKKHVTDATASFQSPTSASNGCGLKKIVTDATVTVSFQSAASATKECGLKTAVTDATASFQSPTCSLVSSFAGGSVEGSVSNGRQVSSLGVVAPAPSFSSRKPPLPSSHRKRLSTEMNNSVSGTGCHCCKRRKTGSKPKVRRIPIIGSKVESIPADDYSWKKYGETKVDGSPFPRVYYRCNSVEGCPARKRVELSLTDSKMLIVTYDREHRH